MEKNHQGGYASVSKNLPDISGASFLKRVFVFQFGFSA